MYYADSLFLCFWESHKKKHDLSDLETLLEQNANNCAQDWHIYRKLIQKGECPLSYARSTNPNDNSIGGISMPVNYFTDTSQLPLFLNVKMTAQLLGIPVSCLYNLIRNNNFPAIHLNKRIIIPKKQFLQWVDQHVH